MLRGKVNCAVCGYKPVCIAGYWAFMPVFCCSSEKAKRMAHKGGKGR